VVRWFGNFARRLQGRGQLERVPIKQPRERAWLVRQRGVASNPMRLRHHLYRAAQNAASAIGIRSPLPKMLEFALKPGEIAALRSLSTDGIGNVFFESKRRPVHKWAHYLDVYDRYLAKYRDQSMFFLEIGVMDGGSLDMWRTYFGTAATIVGVDINPECASRVEPPNFVRIGSQDDPAFLQSIVSEFGSPDIILDDGSHIGRHQRKSFEILLPLLKEGGLYIIEDVHTSYWPDWEGGYRRKGSAIELTKQMIDDMHAWYHNRKTQTPAQHMISGIHVFDSITIIEKKKRGRPGFLSSV
jgi:Methyltransferase domain